MKGPVLLKLVFGFLNVQKRARKSFVEEVMTLSKLTVIQ
jgi:hypothetical protein